jgi:hypothetical protein
MRKSQEKGQFSIERISSIPNGDRLVNNER